MSKLKNVTLQDFQSQVQRKYRHLNSLRKLDKEIQKDSREKRYGCLFLPLYLIAEFFVKIAKRRKIYSAAKEEAGYLLLQKEVKSAICRAFTELGRKEIVTEEKFVNLMTKAIWAADKQKKNKNILRTAALC